MSLQDAIYQAAVKQLREDKFTSYYDEATEVKTWPKWVSRINVPTQAVSIPGLVSPISVPRGTGSRVKVSSTDGR